MNRSAVPALFTPGRVSSAVSDVGMLLAVSVSNSIGSDFFIALFPFQSHDADCMSHRKVLPKRKSVSIQQIRIVEVRIGVMELGLLRRLRIELLLLKFVHIRK